MVLEDDVWFHGAPVDAEFSLSLPGVGKHLLRFFKTFGVDPNLLSDRPSVANASWVVGNQLIEQFSSNLCGECLHELVCIFKIRPIVKAEPNPLAGLGFGRKFLEGWFPLGK